jgi:hypothetical protein
MKNKDQILLESIYERILLKEEMFKFPLMVFHGTDVESAKVIKQNGLDLSKCDRGYFGKAFYVTADEQLAISNYADFTGDEEGGIVLEFEMNPINRILDLRDSSDWDFYKQNNIEKYLGSDNIPNIMKRLGVDALYDRSNDAFAVYNLDILKIKNI